MSACKKARSLSVIGPPDSQGGLLAAFKPPCVPWALRRLILKSSVDTCGPLKKKRGAAHLRAAPSSKRLPYTKSSRANASKPSAATQHPRAAKQHPSAATKYPQHRQIAPQRRQTTPRRRQTASHRRQTTLIHRETTFQRSQTTPPPPPNNTTAPPNNAPAPPNGTSALPNNTAAPPNNAPAPPNNAPDLFGDGVFDILSYFASSPRCSRVLIGKLGTARINFSLQVSRKPRADFEAEALPVTISPKPKQYQKLKIKNCT